MLHKVVQRRSYGVVECLEKPTVIGNKHVGKRKKHFRQKQSEWYIVTLNPFL